MATPPSHLEVTSPDGTALGAVVEGSGPRLLLVHGSTADHTRWAPLVPLLRDDFTCVQLDRRGRGLSAREGGAYSIDREGEDIVAVLTALPRPAMVLAHSYGATVMLDVLDRIPADAALLYEPPFATSAHPVFTADQLARWTAALAEGQRESVLEAFYRETLQFDDARIDALRVLPIWQARIAAVHTIVREGEALRAFEPPELAVPMPVRVLLGTETAADLAASTRAAAAALVGSELHLLADQGHVAIDTAPDLVAKHVRETWRQAQR